MNEKITMYTNTSCSDPAAQNLKMDIPTNIARPAMGRSWHTLPNCLTKANEGSRGHNLGEGSRGRNLGEGSSGRNLGEGSRGHNFGEGSSGHNLGEGSKGHIHLGPIRQRTQSWVSRTP